MVELRTKENSTKSSYHEISQYRNWAIKAARDLYYGNGIVQKLRAAKTESEIEHIMVSARKGVLG